jgi:hypothetical protein
MQVRRHPLPQPISWPVEPTFCPGRLHQPHTALLKSAQRCASLSRFWTRRHYCSVLIDDTGLAPTHEAVFAFDSTLIALAIMTSSCSDPLTRDAVSPATFPSEITVIRATADSTTTQRQGATFPLLDGAFKLTVRRGSTNAGGIIGPYNGTAEVPVPGRASATLEIRVQRATGVASEVTAVAAEGTGAAFVGEGTSPCH